jgi:acyl transferase domain-containing protein
MTDGPERVAIVGMAVLYPGAKDLEAYWRNLVDGFDAVTDVPPNRWRPDYYDPTADTPDRVYCNRGGFVDDLADFDPLRFGTPPASVPNTEPEQLLALQVAAAAIDDAGGPDTLPDRERVGVIIGRGGNPSAVSIDFYSRVRLARDMTDVLRQLVPEVAEERLDAVRERLQGMFPPYRREDVIGLVPNLTASRVANRLDLRGPAYTIDAACASSLIAVDHGVGELLRGRLDAVLAGGVHHSHDIGYWSLFAQLGAMSRRGRIRPFDAAADGLVIGEGTGVVLLKRLSDALRDGNRVHAVIRGVGVSSDGRAASLFNPESKGQALAVRRAWESAGLDPGAPDALGLLEAHGTATPTGDAAELRTMAAVFGPAEAVAGRRAPVIGSVKSMIGHAMPAAGIASLVKATLAVSRGVLLPTLHCDDPRPEMAATRFAPIATARPWDDGPGPRRAAVNGFGFGGINAHVIVEQPPQPRPAARTGARKVGGASVAQPDPVVLLAAPDPEGLARLLDADDDAVRAHGDAAGTDPHAGPCRLAVVRPSARRLAVARQAVTGGVPWRGLRDVWFSPRPLLAGGAGRVAYVFPGLEREYLPRVDDVIARFGLPDGTEAPAPGRAGPVEFTSGVKDDRTANLVRMGQVLTHALAGVGVTPDAVVGYSLGEWTAGLVAGLVDVPTLLAYGAILGSKVPRDDLMLAVVGLGGPDVQRRLAAFPGVVLSHDNSPAQAVVCGPGPTVTAFLAELTRDGIVHQRLPFVTALHTPYMADTARPLREVRGWTAAPGPRATAMWSPTTAGRAPETAAGVRELFLRQLVEPVRFRPTVAAMYDAGVRVFLQLGPGQVSSLVQDNLHGRDHLAMPVNVSHHSGLNQLRRVAAALWVEGGTPDFTALRDAPTARPRPTVRLRLGGTPFDLGEGAERLLGVTTGGTVEALHGTGSPVAQGFAALLRDTADSAAAVLAAATPSTVDRTHRSVLRVDLASMPHLRDHCFFAQPPQWPHDADRWPVVPATAVIAHLVEAVERSVPGRVVAVTDARFARWTLAAPAQDVEIVATPAGDGRLGVSFGGNARATVEVAAGYPPPPPVWRHDPATERPAPIPAARMYADRLLFHGARYQGLTRVHAIGERHARGTVRALPAPGALLDAGWHLLSNWLVSTQERRTVAYPLSVGSLRFFGPPPPVDSILDCVGRIDAVDDGRIIGSVQFSSGGRVWAELRECVHRRFDTQPRLWAQERFPGTTAVSALEPEGWTSVFTCWTDPQSQNFTAHHVLGETDYAEYDALTVAARRPWLLRRLAVKDAVRYARWRDGADAVFPVEVRVGADGAVNGWEVASAQAGDLAVAIARRDGTGPPGIGVAEVTADGLDAALRTATGDALSTVDVTRPHTITHREIANPDGLRPRRYVVAWTAHTTENA